MATHSSILAWKVPTAFPSLGEAVPGDIFSGTVSPEVWRTSGTQLTGEGKTTWTGLCSVGEV